jgi:hypothetical protein
MLLVGTASDEVSTHILLPLYITCMSGSDFFITFINLALSSLNLYSSSCVALGNLISQTGMINVTVVIVLMLHKITYFN